MQKTIKLKKGLDVKLIGAAEKRIEDYTTDFYAVKPTDFHGISPKLMVNVGDKVKVGSTIFLDKTNESFAFTSPVSGTIHEIVRGEKRKLMEIQIKADSVQEFVEFGPSDINSISKEQLIDKLLKSGAWVFIKQRPYNVIANPNVTPKAIFVSAFDSSPLAPSIDFIIENNLKDFQIGLNLLKKLSGGKVHLSYSKELSKSSLYTSLSNVDVHEFSGPHPAGNVGIQIHHIDPLIKGDIVWTVGVQDVINLAKTIYTGKFTSEKIVALTGSEVLSPKYYRTVLGASIKGMVENNVKNGELRYISGNVLTGDQISKSGFIGAFHQQVTVIPEGNYYEFLGWAMPGLGKFSLSRAFTAWLTPSKEYKVDTNLHGEHRAFVMTGQYDKVLPMNIMPVVLLKNILAENIEKMEQLGIYEVVEEDLALCEVVCTSKIDVQEIVRKGLDLIRKEMN